MAGAGVIMTRPGQPGPTHQARGERVVSAVASDMRGDHDDGLMINDEPQIVKSMTDAL